MTRPQYDVTFNKLTTYLTNLQLQNYGKTQQNTLKNDHISQYYCKMQTDDVNSQRKCFFGN